jgi:hypothetical protein
MGFKPILDKVIALIRMNVPGQLGCLNAQDWSSLAVRPKGSWGICEVCDCCSCFDTVPRQQCSSTFTS